MVAENIQKRAQLLDGAVVAEKIKQEVKSEIEQMREKHGVQPGLACLLYTSPSPRDS